MNRDEQVGPNKPFADITVALASAGYAVLRYDKRGSGESTTAAHWLTRATLLDDAKAAFDLLAHDRRIDASRIFVIGHSEGGELTLGLAASRPVRGVVLLAPLAKPYTKALQEQMHRLPRDRLALAGFIKDNAAFLASYKGIDPSEEIALISQPMLLLHGEKDVNVSESEAAALYATALRAHRDIAYHELPDDNHFFMRLAGARLSTGDEFGEPHPFDSEAIQEILSWLKVHAGAGR